MHAVFLSFRDIVSDTYIHYFTLSITGLHFQRKRAFSYPHLQATSIYTIDKVITENPVIAVDFIDQVTLVTIVSRNR